jgi:indole-3-glycerol phosphate synthase
LRVADVLDRILAVKAEEIARAKATRDLVSVRREAEAAPAPYDFAGALRSRVAAGAPAVIAEIKKASPSRGILRNPFDAGEIAHSYASHGATCLSVLTDEQFFHGSAENLRVARRRSGLPCLRKDFIIDPYQVYEARALAADCILLIVAALADDMLSELQALALGLGMSVLVEIHDAGELDRALALGEMSVLGINNRNLRTFETALATTIALAPRIPAGRLAVSESGILTRADVARLQKHGIHAFLVGEAFMRSADPGKALEELFATP